jgi:hypothetical protein
MIRYASDAAKRKNITGPAILHVRKVQANIHISCRPNFMSQAAEKQSRLIRRNFDYENRP